MSDKSTDQALLNACRRSQIWFERLQELDAEVASMPHGITPASEVLEEAAGTIGDRWLQSLQKVFETPASSETGWSAKKKALTAAILYYMPDLRGVPEAEVIERLAWLKVLNLQVEI